jgi:hypothetical protein
MGNPLERTAHDLLAMSESVSGGGVNPVNTTATLLCLRRF